MPNADQHEDVIKAEARLLADSLLAPMQAGLAAGGERKRRELACFACKSETGCTGLAFDSKIKSYAAQMILEDVSQTHQYQLYALASALHGCVRSAFQSPHAIHVVEQIFKLMPFEKAQFIIDELKGFAYDVACDQYGCRGFKSIIDHLSPQDSSAIELVEEVLVGLDQLCITERGTDAKARGREDKRKYFSFVARHLLEHDGLPEHKRFIVQVLCTNPAGYSKTQFGSPVVEAALDYASTDDMQTLARKLLADKEQLMTLAGRERFGWRVVKTLVKAPNRSSIVRQEALAVLLPMEAELRASRYGQSVLREVRKAAAAAATAAAAAALAA
jgi:hypothetical protein